jgi:hypothetical protein
MPRDIAEVIDRVKDLLPEEYSLVAIPLDHLKQAAAYTAPESRHQLWERLGAILAGQLPSPDGCDAPAWAAQIGRIVRGEE